MRTIWPFRHFGLGLLSVGLALTLWLVVSGEETAERTLRIPLEFQQFPVGLEIVGEAPSSVDARVRGASDSLARIGPGDILAELDLHTAKPGRRLFQLTPTDVHAPWGVEVVQVAPSTIAMAFEASATRKVPIVPDIQGRPAPGFVVGRVAVEPNVAEVVGPASAVARAVDAFTESVSVAGASDTVKDVVTVGLLEPSLRLTGARSAVVTVQIEPAPIERTFRDMPVHLRHVPPSLTASATPSVATVTLRGSREAFARAEREGIEAFVDVAGLGIGAYSLPLHVDAGEAGTVRCDPPSVHVQVSGGKN